VAAGISVLGQDDVYPSRMTNAITIRNNLFLDVSHASYGGTGALLLTLGGDGITIDHNTVFTDGTSVVYADVAAALGLSLTNNIFPDNSWAIKGSGTAAGNDTIAKYYPGSIIRRNVFTAGHAGPYPVDNFFPATVAAVGFVDVSGGNYQLTAASPYLTSATDGSAVGADPLAILSVVPLAP
jgi:hypothetical protein